MLAAGLVIFKYYKLIFPFFHFSWLAPVGISFYTFKAISYCIEVAKKRMDAETSYLNCWLYLSFFPVFTAGPINRPKSFFTQLKKQRPWKTSRIESGLIRTALGCFEKVVIADNLLILVDSIYFQCHLLPMARSLRRFTMDCHDLIFFSNIFRLWCLFQYGNWYLEMFWI